MIHPSWARPVCVDLIVESSIHLTRSVSIFFFHSVFASSIHCVGALWLFGVHFWLNVSEHNLVTSKFVFDSGPYA